MINLRLGTLALLLGLLGQQFTNAQIVSFDLQTDTQTLTIGDRLHLDVFVSDLRIPPSGIVSAYLDLTYPPAQLSVIDGSFAYGPGFSFLSADVPPTLGLIDEVGGFATGLGSLPLPPEFPGKALLFSVDFKAIALGEATLATRQANILPRHSITVLGDNNAVSASEVAYGSTTHRIIPEPGGATLLLFSLLLLPFLRASRR